MSLIDTLEQEHDVLKGLFAEIQALGITSDAGLEKLRKSKAVLLAHLKKEDDQLYPALKKLEDGRQIANAFQTEMGEISKQVLAFYDKYEGGIVTDNLTFSKELGRLLGAIKQRMIKEESTLYMKYKKHYS